MAKKAVVVVEYVGQYDDRDVEIQKVLLTSDKNVDMNALKKEYEEKYSSFVTWLKNMHGFEEADIIGVES